MCMYFEGNLYRVLNFVYVCVCIDGFCILAYRVVFQYPCLLVYLSLLLYGCVHIYVADACLVPFCVLCVGV